LGTKDEISRAAVRALAAGNGCGAQARDSLSYLGIADIPAHLDHRACKLVSENHWGVVPKRIVKHVKVGSADPTEGYFKLDLVVSASWFVNFPYIDISFATCIFDQRFHGVSSPKPFPQTVAGSDKDDTDGLFTIKSPSPMLFAPFAPQCVPRSRFADRSLRRYTGKSAPQGRHVTKILARKRRLPGRRVPHENWHYWSAASR
jgi:hypothetical protein